MTGDVQSIRARRVGGNILVRVVDEYENEFATGERVYDEPLKLGELVELIDAADVVGSDSSPGALVLGTVRTWFTYGEDLDGLVDAAQASSAFYPDLARHYEDAVHGLVSELRSPPGG